MSRQLDAAIAEALGNIVKAEDGGYYGNSIKAYCEGTPDYSTDGNAMLEVDREMRERGWLACTTEYEDFIEVEYVTSPRDKCVVVTGSYTEPLARALAAYKALTGKEWAEHD